MVALENTLNFAQTNCLKHCPLKPDSHLAELAYSADWILHAQGNLQEEHLAQSIRASEIDYFNPKAGIDVGSLMSAMEIVSAGRRALLGSELNFSPKSCTAQSRIGISMERDVRSRILRIYQVSLPQCSDS